MKIKKSIFKTENFLIILFTFVYVFTDFIHISSLIGNMFVALAGLISFFYIILKKGLNKWTVNHVVLYAVMLSLCMICSILYNSNANITNILWIWGYAGIALVLWIYPLSPKLLYGIFYVIAFIFLIYALRGGDPQQVFSSISGNNISTVVMYFMLIAYWKGYSKDKPLPYIPAVIFVIISLWANGRAGFSTSLLFLAMVFVYNFFYIKERKLRTLLIIICSMVIGGYILNHFLGEAVLQYQYKLQRYGMTSVRTEIWVEYINGAFTNIGNFVFGLSTKNSIYPKLSYYGGNTHNAFLMLHSKYGIFGFSFFIYKIISASVQSLKKRDYLFFIIIFLVVFRSFFDWTAFPGLFDVYFWLMLLYVEKKKKFSWVGDGEIL